MAQKYETEISCDGQMEISDVQSVDTEEQGQLPAHLWSEADFLASIPARFRNDLDVLEMAANFRR